MTIIAALGFLVSSVSFANAANIVETAQKAGTFNTLIAAAKAAGLAGTLAEGKNLTVFAPTDEAFAALPEGTVENLLKPENKDQLIAILTYHVVPGAVKAAKVVDLSSAKTVNGADIAIAVSNGTVTVDNATVIKTDIAAANGVIHVIDRVILPN